MSFIHETCIQMCVPMNFFQYRERHGLAALVKKICTYILSYVFQTLNYSTNVRFATTTPTKIIDLNFIYLKQQSTV